MSVTRETVNRVRYLLEDLLPAAIRDSLIFLPLMYLAHGRRTRRILSFRARARDMSEEEFSSYYADLVPLMGATDLCRTSFDAILADVVGRRVADIGCGRGQLIASIAGRYPATTCIGIDIDTKAATAKRGNLVFEQGWLGRLAHADDSFDTVVCTHTLEHVPNLAGAMADLRRIARRRLILVVPREREFRYAFNLHVHFFPYLHSFLNQIGAPAGRHRGRLIGRDIYYVENLADELKQPADCRQEANVEDDISRVD